MMDSVGTSKTVVKRMPITRARVNLGDVVKRAHLNGEYFILEKDGIPIAGLMDADELEDYLELRDPTVVEQIKWSRDDETAGRIRPARDFLAELKAGRGPKATRSKKSKTR